MASFKALHFCYDLHNLLHVRIGVGNNLLHLSDMLYFEGTETPGKTYSTFPMTFFILFLHYIDYNMKILCKKQHCVFTNKRNVYYIVFQTAD
jgi:hypothetical protein